MSRNSKEVFKPLYHHTPEGEKFFNKLIIEYKLEEDNEHLIIPLKNDVGEEKRIFIFKSEEIRLANADSVKIEEYIKQVIADAAEDGFNLKTHEAQASEMAA